MSAIMGARIHGVQGRLDLNLGHWNTYHILLNLRGWAIRIFIYGKESFRVSIPL